MVLAAGCTAAAVAPARSAAAPAAQGSPAPPPPPPPPPPWHHPATDAPPARLHPAVAVVELEPLRYDVDGATLTALRATLAARRPLDSRGVPHHAITRWQAEWKFQLARRRGRCHVGAIRVTLTIGQTWPRRRARADADRALVERWDHYERALLAHEAGHRTVAVHAASAIAGALAGMTGATCEALAAAANARGQAIRGAHLAIEADYDRVTRHGATTGASL